MNHSGARSRALILSLIFGGSALLFTILPAFTQQATAATPSVVRWAEPVGAPPNYIFPFSTQENYSVANVDNFQHLLFRPLYWFGDAGTPNLNRSLSLAEPPKFSNGNTTVTVTLKRNKWSDGEEVTAQDVLFWLNMLHADKNWWPAYSPGSLPDSLRAVTLQGTSRLVLKLTGPVNPSWFLDNQLSQITPFPLAWDVTSLSATPKSGGCASAAWGTGDAACNQVFTWLSAQAGFNVAIPSQPNQTLSTYASNPLWQIVDGPWRLASFDASGHADFVPNLSYTAGKKPAIANFVEIPFTSEASEYSALTSGAIDVGYLPRSHVTAATSQPFAPAQVTSKLAGFVLRPTYPWAISFLRLNFKNTQENGASAAILSQAYVRQAMQMLLNQTVYIHDIYKGFALPNSGVTPSAIQATATEGVTTKNAFPYNPKKATALLQSHGWTIHKGGVSTCTSPGSGSTECGTGIPGGAPLTFTLEYSSDVGLLGELMNAEQAAWKQVGLSTTLLSAPALSVVTTSSACVAGQSCSWELSDSGLDWFFSPASYPSSEQLFLSGTPGNTGSYGNQKADALIASSLTTSRGLGPAANYLSQQVPVIFEPTPALQLTEIRSTLHGVTPLSPVLSLTPELWHF